MEMSKKAYNNFKDGKASLQEVFDAICYEIVINIKSTRASIWFFDLSKTEIHCKSLYDSRTKQFTGGAILKEADFPNYFSAINDGCVVSAPDAMNNPATECFNELYFEPNDIVSLLDFIVLRTGVPIGVLCCEHCVEKKEWSDQDKEYLNQMSSLVAFTYKSAEKQTR